MEYPLFVWLTFVMFIRPWELIPELEPLNLYYWSIIVCFAVSFSRLSAVWKMVGREPITTCVVGFWFAIIFSHLIPWNFSLYFARTEAFEFFKNVLLYMLALVALDTQKRFLKYIDFLSICAFCVVLMATLDYNEYIDFAAIKHHVERAAEFSPNGSRTIVTLIRMCGPGVFADPNDISMLIMMGMIFAASSVMRKNASPLRRLVGMLQIAFLGWAYTFTQSRGGFMMIVAAFATLMLSQMRTRTSIPLLVTVLPAFFVLFGGRATSIDMESGSGQSRIQLWSDAMLLFRSNLIAGAGHHQILEYLPQVVHNSYLHSYAETGLIGGSLFLGIWVFSVRGLWVTRPKASIPAGASPEFAQFQPYLMGIIAGVMVGMVSLSRNDVLPTYLFAGLVASYTNLIRKQTGIEQGRPRRGYIVTLLIASFVCLVLIQLMIRFNVVRG